MRSKINFCKPRFCRPFFSKYFGTFFAKFSPIFFKSPRSRFGEGDQIQFAIKKFNSNHCNFSLKLRAGLQQSMGQAENKYDDAIHFEVVRNRKVIFLFFEYYSFFQEIPFIHKPRHVGCGEAKAIFCTKPRFGGDCIEISNSQHSLNSLGFKKKMFVSAKIEGIYF